MELWLVGCQMGYTVAQLVELLHPDPASSQQNLYDIYLLLCV